MYVLLLRSCVSYYWVFGAAHLPPGTGDRVPGAGRCQGAAGSDEGDGRPRLFVAVAPVHRLPVPAGGREGWAGGPEVRGVGEGEAQGEAQIRHLRG